MPGDSKWQICSPNVGGHVFTILKRSQRIAIYTNFSVGTPKSELDIICFSKQELVINLTLPAEDFVTFLWFLVTQRNRLSSEE